MHKRKRDIEDDETMPSTKFRCTSASDDDSDVSVELPGLGQLLREFLTLCSCIRRTRCILGRKAAVSLFVPILEFGDNQYSTRPGVSGQARCRVSFSNRSLRYFAHSAGTSNHLTRKRSLIDLYLHTATQTEPPERIQVVPFKEDRIVPEVGLFD
jgi:hypothetical protein